MSYSCEISCRLRLIAPVIKDHGIDYERGKFQDKLRDGTLTLERTRDWIRTCLRHEVAARAAGLDGLLAGQASSYESIHSAAMLALVADPTPLTPERCPETLLFDVHRLSLLQREFQRVVTSATMLVTAAHGVGTAKNLKFLNPADAALVSDTPGHFLRRIRANPLLKFRLCLQALTRIKELFIADSDTKAEIDVEQVCTCLSTQRRSTL
jgi:hypothetical protein